MMYLDAAYTWHNSHYERLVVHMRLHQLVTCKGADFSCALCTPLSILVMCTCCRCGQLGHLTKQCRNQFSRFFDGGPGAEKDAAQQAAAAAGVPTAAIAMAPLAAHAGGCWCSSLSTFTPFVQGHRCPIMKLSRR